MRAVIPDPVPTIDATDTQPDRAGAVRLPAFDPARSGSVSGSVSGLGWGLDDLADWRLGLLHDLQDLADRLQKADLLTADAASQILALRQRLHSDRLVLAFVAEFSRGKSELINAIFFADAGQRVLPATPGRTTMCPVEFAWDPTEPAALALLPLASRLQPDSLAEWRQRPEAWRSLPLDPQDSGSLVAALAEVTRTQRVSRDEARALGLWRDEAEPGDELNPPSFADGTVELPAWRHALVNLPHPLLRSGLVLVDTPGLNAIGAEPELTLNLLPSAHAVLFVLGADTGVTRSDLTVWNQHLADPAMARFVVLNKVDAMRDPLLGPEAQQALVDQQCQQVAGVLGVVREQVFPVSARQALVARLAGDPQGLRDSGLPLLEAALQHRLLPQRRRLMAAAVVSRVQSIQSQIARRVRDLRRAHAEQMLELRSLRGKSQGRIDLMLGRVERDGEEFQRCLSRLNAVRAVQQRLMAQVLSRLDNRHLRDAAARLQEALAGGWFKLGAKGSFAQVCATLDGQLAAAAVDVQEAQRMLDASFHQLNAEFAFALETRSAPRLLEWRDEIAHIEQGYARYFSLTSLARMHSPQFAEQFQRMLVAKLRTVFEQAAQQLDQWSEAQLQQLDDQFKDRRRAFHQRRDTLARIRQATGDLDERLAEVEQADQRLLASIDEAYSRCAALTERARLAVPDEAPGPGVQPAARA